MLAPQFTRLLVSQRVAMALALAPRARAEAKKRQGRKSAPFKAGAMDVVAASVGWSRATFTKALAVINAAKRDRRRFGDLADLMDATGRVDRAYRQLRAREGRPQTNRAARAKLRKTRSLFDLLLEQLGALNIEKAESEIANCRVRIAILEGFIASAFKLYLAPPRTRRFLNLLPAPIPGQVIAAVQNKQERR